MLYCRPNPSLVDAPERPMPEIIEVELLCRDLRRWLDGRRVRLEAPDVGAEALEQSVTAIRRRGKYALIEGQQTTWVLHLRMTGKVVPSRGGKARARFHTSEGVYDFEDTRRLGTLEATARFDDAHLGPEPWPARRDGSWWRAQLRTRSAIKVALMRQDLVAGLGNIAASEILFRARIHPWRPVPELRRWDALAHHAHAYLDDLLAHEQGQEIQYVNQGGPNPFRVYGKTACPDCGGSLSVGTQSGRSTWHCPRCQPG